MSAPASIGVDRRPGYIRKIIFGTVRPQSRVNQPAKGYMRVTRELTILILLYQSFYRLRKVDTGSVDGADNVTTWTRESRCPFQSMTATSGYQLTLITLEVIIAHVNDLHLLRLHFLD
jgi:hypothetical protein